MDVHNELVECTAEWLAKANTIFNRNFTMPHISLQLTGGTAGTANYTHWVIRYNTELYIRNKETFKSRTVPHELAHLVARSLYGNHIKSHGREWRSVMMRLGVAEVTRCHSYDVTGIVKRRERPYVYACACTEHHVTQNIHNKIVGGQVRKCVKCRQVVTLKQKEN